MLCPFFNSFTFDHLWLLELFYQLKLSVFAALFLSFSLSYSRRMPARRHSAVCIRVPVLLVNVIGLGQRRDGAEEVIKQGRTSTE
jgi:hypothetical protein